MNGGTSRAAASCTAGGQAFTKRTGDRGERWHSWAAERHGGRGGESVGTPDILFGMDAETVRAMLLRNLGRAADDPVGSHDMYDDDAVLEFPQSGERFEGVANIREWRSRYPGSVSYDIRRIRGADEIWVAEMTVSYDGGEPRYGVDVLEVRNGRVARETIYVGEPFDAPEWREQWRVAP
jgi:SnoaL-like protein